ncbi:MAG: hypothetical protein IJM91_03735 [Lachnospiraceae bacterium]|nr:hypothetical protein [Lachnospiraceae bacterium]MBR0434873.1 hypothetical protein [Lachnospiraceae bacterium]
MKKKLFSVVLIMMLVASLLVGCGKDKEEDVNYNGTHSKVVEDDTDDNQDDNDSDDNDDTDDNDDSDDNDNTDNNAPVTFELSFVEEQDMGRYPGYHGVVLDDFEGAPNILIMPSGEIKNVVIYRLEYEDYDATANEVIYKLADVMKLDTEGIGPNKPIFLKGADLGETFPKIAFGYTDADGQNHVISITESGKDGSLVQTEMNQLFIKGL